MPRRASSSAHPIWIALAALLIVGALAGGYFLFSNVSDPYRTLTPMDVPAYLENANSLRGNVYKLNATIVNKLAWAPATGSLYSIEVESGGDLLPLLIPASFNHVNIQKGQRFFFKVEVGDQGILRVQDIRKV